MEILGGLKDVKKKQQTIVCCLILKLLSGRRVSNPLPTAWKAVALPNELLPQGDVGGGGFEPPKASPTDLQSAPFDRSGTLPIEPIDGLEPPTG